MPLLIVSSFNDSTSPYFIPFPFGSNGGRGGAKRESKASGGAGRQAGIMENHVNDKLGFYLSPWNENLTKGSMRWAN